jgi:hypothetical protein
MNSLNERVFSTLRFKIDERNKKKTEEIVVIFLSS